MSPKRLTITIAAYYILLSLNCVVVAQSSLSTFQNTGIDSLQNVYDTSSGEARIEAGNTLSVALLDSDPGRSEELMTILIEEAERAEYNQGLMDALNNKADFLSKRHSYNAANRLLGRSIPLARKSNDMSRLSRANLILGFNLQRLYKYDTAVRVYLEGVKQAQAQGHFKSELNYLTNIGIVKTELNDFESADEYFQNALVIGQEHNLKSDVGRVYANLGILEFDRANYSLAKKYHLKSYEIFEVLDAKIPLGILLTHLGRVSSKMNEMEKSLDFFDRALVVRKEFDGPRALASVMRYKAQALYSFNRFAESQMLSEEALLIGEEYDDLVLMKDLYVLNVNLAETRKDYKTALMYYKQLVVVQDSTRDRAGKGTVDRLTAEFDRVKLESEAALQTQNAEIAQLKVARRNLLLVVLILLFLSTAIVFWLNRLRLKQRLEVSQNQQKLMAKELELKGLEINNQEQKISAFQEERDSQAEEDVTLAQLAGLVQVSPLQSNHWLEFRAAFDKRFSGFYRQLETHPLTTNEQRLSSLIKLGLASKEVASILAITPKSVNKAKSRLASKLDKLNVLELEIFLQNLS